MVPDTDFSRLTVTQQQNLLSLKHEPIRPVRKYTPGEGMYLKAWQDYLAVDLGRLKVILTDTMRNIDQRDAAVCAQFMSYMGTNCGRDFTWQTDTHVKMLRETSSPELWAGLENQYLMVWGRFNARVSGVNSGVRTIEAMLSEHYHMRDDTLGGMRVDWLVLDKIQARDYDTVECMVRWWSTRDAVAIRADVAPRINEVNQQLHSQGWSPQVEAIIKANPSTLS